MNALALMTVALVAGADPVSIPAPSPAPGALAGCSTCNSGCGPMGCSGASDECPGTKKGLFSKLGGGCKGCGHSGAGMHWANTVEKPSLMSLLRSRSSSSHGCNGCEAPAPAACASCAAAVMTAPPMLAPAPTVPQKMDPPATAPGKKEGAAPGKTSQRAAPQTVIPTSGPRLLVPLATSGSPF